MKTSILAVIALSLALTLTARAQVPGIINYQARVIAGGTNFDGTGQFKFALVNGGATSIYWSNGNSAVSLPVTKGLYSVLLGDTGVTNMSVAILRSVFSNSAVWLRVQFNDGVNGFQTLNPDQRLGAVGYALMAANVTGNGAGLTNVPGAIPTVIVAGTNALTQANTGYAATNASPVTFSLPPSANVGDVVKVDGLGAGGWQFEFGAGINGFEAGQVWTPRDSNRQWRSVASSADGSKLVAVASNGQIYTSTDSGTNWTARDSNRQWFSVASSSDGSKLVAVVLGGQIYTSTDSGTSWTARDSNRFWKSVASSADGSKLVAVDGSPGQIYTSTDSGTNWSARDSNRNWFSVASSSDGSKLVAVVDDGQIYTSTDSGTNWSARDSDRFWWSVASSADGSKLVAVASNGQIYTSTDSGTNWTARDSNRNWQSVASSSDGSKLVAGEYGGQIYTSTDSGTNWTARDSNRNWQSVASSSDGSKLVAVVYGSQIYTSTAIQLAGAQGSSVELEYAGNGRWQPVTLPQSSASAPNTTVSRDANGNFAAGVITATSFIGDGSGLQLSPNVALLDRSPQTFSGTNIFNSRVGIGTSSPKGALHVAGGVAVTGDSSPHAGAGPGVFLDTISGKGYVFAFDYGATNASLPLLLNSPGGNVGIGTTNPGFLLEVNGTAGKPGGGSWSSASDVRLKKNIHPLEDVLDKLLALHGVSFEFKDPEKIHELSGERIGMIAQEVEPVFPDWVETGPNGYKRLTYRGFEALTVEALRQLRAEKDAQIEELRRQNDALEKRLEVLERRTAR